MRTIRILTACFVVAALAPAILLAQTETGTSPWPPSAPPQAAAPAAAPAPSAAPAASPAAAPKAATKAPAKAAKAKSVKSAATTAKSPPVRAPLAPASTLAPSAPPTAPAPPRAGAAAPAAPPFAPPPPAPAPRTFPYAAYINGDAVNLRSGPGLYYYPLTILAKDMEVTVEGEAGAFLAVKPPEDVFGLMKRADLAMSVDGKSATVAVASARVYASSASATRQWCVMGALKQGDKVEVQGSAEGDMVKVAPPEGAHAFVDGRYVTAGSSGSKNSELLSKMRGEPPKADPLWEDLKEADRLLAAEQQKPVDQRDFAAAAAAFKEIGEKTRQKECQRASTVGDRLQREIAEIEGQSAAKEAEAAREKRLARPEFVATGMIQPLESMENVDYPIKFKLVDQNGHTLVVLNSNTYDLSKFVGKVVGLRGEKTWLKAWGIYLVTVDDIETLE